MFREMRRIKQALSEGECVKILKEEKRGVLAVSGDGGYPYAVPINFYYDEEENAIYFHSAKNGHKIDAMKNCDKVCFTVINGGEKSDDWSYYVKSVIIFGRAAPVTDPDLKLKKLKAFGMKYYPSEEELEKELARDYGRVELMCIKVEHMTGKLVHEK
jgi:nitroimidazol reductase NimA-like FMN-containing flavoprotein (pyridoxamine 5'-phosphate oxidase superfamily)